MRRWIPGLLCCGLAASLATAARAQERGDDPFSETRQKYNTLKKESDGLRDEMNEMRRVYDNDPEVMVAEKASDAARKACDEALKASSAIARAREATSAARKRFDEAARAALATDSQAGPVFRRYQEVTRRLEAIKTEIRTLGDEERKLKRELETHRHRLYRNPEVARDARAAVAAAEKACSEAIRGDAAVQEARKIYEEAKDNHRRIRDAKLATDPLYAELAEKYKALYAQTKALQEQVKRRKQRKPR